MSSARETRKGSSQPSSVFRASCDACHRAKVKCVFEDQIVCLRCQSQHRHCHKSLVSKLGRRSIRRNLHDLGDIDDICNDLRQTQSVLPLDFAGDPPSTASENAQGLCVGFGVWEGHSTKSHYLDIEWSTGKIDQTIGFNMNMFPIDQPRAVVESDVSALDDGSISMSAPLEFPRIEAGILLAHCDCEAKLMKSLTDLQYGSEGSTRLDHTLNHNKHACGTIHTVLSCEVPHDHSVVLLLFILLQSLLLCYQRTSYLRRNHIFTTPTSTSNNATSNNEADGEIIQLGEYTMDIEDEHTVRKHILLLDLGKLATVIKRTVLRVQQKDDSMRPNLYSFLEKLLSKEAATISRQISS